MLAEPFSFNAPAGPQGGNAPNVSTKVLQIDKGGKFDDDQRLDRHPGQPPQGHRRLQVTDGCVAPETPGATLPQTDLTTAGA